MERPRARPKFTLHDPRSPDEIAACLRVHLERGPGKVTGDVMRRPVMLTIAEEHRHFWTPHLDLQLGEAKGGGTHLDGTLGPHPKLWYTFLTYGYPYYAYMWQCSSKVDFTARRR